MITECMYATTEAQCTCLFGRRSHEHTHTGAGLHLNAPSISVAKAWRLDVWLPTPPLGALHRHALRCASWSSQHSSCARSPCHFIFDVLVACCARGTSDACPGLKLRSHLGMGGHCRLLSLSTGMSQSADWRIGDGVGALRHANRCSSLRPYSWRRHLRLRATGTVSSYVSDFLGDGDTGACAGT